MFGYKIFNNSSIYDLTTHNNRHVERRCNMMEYRVKVIDSDGICHTYENIVGISFYITHREHDNIK